MSRSVVVGLAALLTACAPQPPAAPQPRPAQDMRQEAPALREFTVEEIQAYFGTVHNSVLGAGVAETVQVYLREFQQGTVRQGRLANEAYGLIDPRWPSDGRSSPVRAARDTDHPRPRTARDTVYLRGSTVRDTVYIRLPASRDTVYLTRTDTVYAHPDPLIAARGWADALLTLIPKHTFMLLTDEALYTMPRMDLLCDRQRRACLTGEQIAKDPARYEGRVLGPTRR